MGENREKPDSDDARGHEDASCEDGKEADRASGAHEEPVDSAGSRPDASSAAESEGVDETPAETEQARQERPVAPGGGPGQPQQPPWAGPQYGAPPPGGHGPWPRQHWGAQPHPSPYPPYPRPPRPRRPLPSTPAWLPAAVLAAGAGAALFLPVNGPGLGTLVAGIVAALSVASVIRAGWTPWALCYGTLAAILLSTVAVRAADWVVTGSLAGAFALASLAVAVRAPEARANWPGTLYGALALLRNLPATPRFLAAAPSPGGNRRGWQPVLIGISVTALLLLVFGGLLMAADPVFARIILTYFEGLPFRGTMFVLFALGTGAAALTALRPARTEQPEGDAAKRPKPRTPVPMTAWLLPLGALNLLFLSFIAVQAATLFGGEEYVQRATDLTYAEYARQGFFQLLTVGFLVLGVIAAVCWLLRTVHGGERRLRNALLGVLCLLTLLLLASALNRLDLYAETFGLTRLRVLAEAAIWWIGAVFVLVVVAGAIDTFGGRSGWLPRAVVALTGAGLALFAYSDPDLRIAESHVDMPVARIDMFYLNGLSDDAVPALARIVQRADCAYIPEADRIQLRERLDTGTSWTDWNASRRRADALLEEALDDPEILTAFEECGDSAALGWRPHTHLYR
ncbi:DUF4153 domain-containing protein [Thermobifida alba]|uniref:DUF4153 domain-containing protein n=1 Tax=Thermobifida alba TaxID=53522 RepID=UPI0020BF83E7|nr:DUF4173 domain-containing protein [Thermobifida alba]